MVDSSPMWITCVYNPVSNRYPVSCLTRDKLLARSHLTSVALFIRGGLSPGKGTFYRTNLPFFSNEENRLGYIPDLSPRSNQQRARPCPHTAPPPSNAVHLHRLAQQGRGGGGVKTALLVSRRETHLNKYKNAHHCSWMVRGGGWVEPVVW